MRQRFQIRRTSFCILLPLLAFFSTTVRAQIEINGAEFGNVTPFSAAVVWQMSGAATPALQVFSDNAGQHELTDQVRVEVNPLGMGDRSVSSDYQARQLRYALQDLVATRNLGFVRVSGLYPETTYYVRPLALDESGQIVAGATGSLLAVTTAAENSFITESKQLVVAFEGSESSQAQGAIARLESPGLAYPLFEVVGDGAEASEAFFNLDHLLDAQGIANATPDGPLTLRIRLLGSTEIEGQMDYRVTYGGGFATASAAMVAFNTEPILGSFIFDPIADQTVGAPFSITIRALDLGGKPFPEFTGSVTIASNLVASQGAGQSPAFVEGVLEDHALTLSEPGQAVLLAEESGGVSGSSNAFEVEGESIYHRLTLSASPVEGGTVSGAGEYLEGALAPIRAEAALRYEFERWEGPGVADANAASTRVSMSGDRSLTAIFSKSVTPEGDSYDAWKNTAFAGIGDGSGTGPAEDYDGDGLSNLLEYAFGGDPTASQAADFVPRAEGNDGGAPVFVYVRRSSAADLSYAIQLWDGDAGKWTVYTPPADTVEVTPIDAILEEVAFPIPLDSDSALIGITVQQN